jgi:hypothetical protein
MHAAMWFELVVYFHVKLNPWCMGGKRDNKERDLNRKHPFPRVSIYKRRSDMKEVDITD